MNIKYFENNGIGDKEIKKITLLVEEFTKIFDPIEKESIVILKDNRTNALYIECHIKADRLINYSTIDVPLDPEGQAEYRSNRDLVEDHDAFIVMKSDAIEGRSFSNLIGEYNLEYDKGTPFKIIGGQHRYIAIKEALENKKVNACHGIKIYFGLTTEQRLDVQLISNTNIAVSGDLLDRMYETVKGPELRTWCQMVGLLEKNKDFADKKQRGSKITVRGARSFILSYFEGEKLNKKAFEDIKQEPKITKTGVIDDDWEGLRNTKKDLWDDQKLKEAGESYALLLKKQKEYFLTKKDSVEFADKGLNYAIISAWAFIAGILQENLIRLKRHYELPLNSKYDPLNAVSLSKGKHKTDPENYRGLGTRTDLKERGRLCELFYAQAEKGEGISAQMVDFAIKEYHAKLARIEAKEAKERI